MTKEHREALENTLADWHEGKMHDGFVIRTIAEILLSESTTDDCKCGTDCQAKTERRFESMPIGDEVRKDALREALAAVDAVLWENVRNSNDHPSPDVRLMASECLKVATRAIAELIQPLEATNG